MTQEQKQVIDKCKNMLKLAFPDLTGYVRFDMCRDTKKVRACLHVNMENK